VGSLAACAPATTTPNVERPDVSATDCQATGEGTGEIAMLVAQGGFGDDYFIADISSVYEDITTTQRSVRIPGDDAPVALPGSTVTADYAIFNGETGDEIITTIGDVPVDFVLDDAETPTGIVKVFTCSTPKTRVVGIIPASEGFQSPPPGFPSDVPLIIVADVLSVQE
jgi:hypothetical protein